MSIDTTKAMNYSWMSQAAYLDLAAVSTNNTFALLDALQNSALNAQKKFFEQQAKIFTDPATSFSFISQLPNTGNGTSLTVFTSNKDGSYTIAVRGTEPSLLEPSDLLADLLGVVGAGKAKVQLLEAFRYYKQITTVAGQTVTYSLNDEFGRQTA